MRPSKILIKVDFPAPLAPMSPVMPGPTLTVSPSSAVTFPGYTLVSAFVSMTAAAGARTARGLGLMAWCIGCQRAGPARHHPAG